MLEAVQAISMLALIITHAFLVRGCMSVETGAKVGVRMTPIGRVFAGFRSVFLGDD